MWHHWRYYSLWTSFLQCRLKPFKITFTAINLIVRELIVLMSSLQIHRHYENILMQILIIITIEDELLKSLFRTPTLSPPPQKKKEKKICNSDNSLPWLPYIFSFRAENCFLSVGIPHCFTLTSSPFSSKMFVNMYIMGKFLKWHT